MSLCAFLLAHGLQNSNSSFSYAPNHLQSNKDVPTPWAPYMSAKPLPPAEPVELEITGVIKQNSATCLNLDLSLKSKQIGRLIDKDRNQSACKSRIKEIQVVIRHAGNRQIHIYCKKGDPGYLTVGRILGDIHSFLRQGLEGTQSSRHMQASFEKRLETLSLDTRPGLRPSHFELKEKEALIMEERRKGIRNVDALLGYTEFAGFSALGNGLWELHLKPCQRYSR